MPAPAVDAIMTAPRMCPARPSSSSSSSSPAAAAAVSPAPSEGLAMPDPCMHGCLHAFMQLSLTIAVDLADDLLDLLLLLLIQLHLASARVAVAVERRVQLRGRPAACAAGVHAERAELLLLAGSQAGVYGIGACRCSRQHASRYHAPGSSLPSAVSTDSVVAASCPSSTCRRRALLAAASAAGPPLAASAAAAAAASGALGTLSTFLFLAAPAGGLASAPPAAASAVAPGAVSASCLLLPSSAAAAAAGAPSGPVGAAAPLAAFLLLPFFAGAFFFLAAARDRADRSAADACKQQQRELRHRAHAHTHVALAAELRARRHRHPLLLWLLRRRPLPPLSGCWCLSGCLRLLDPFLPQQRLPRPQEAAAMLGRRRCRWRRRRPLWRRRRRPAAAPPCLMSLPGPQPREWQLPCALSRLQADMPVDVCYCCAMRQEAAQLVVGLSAFEPMRW